VIAGDTVHAATGTGGAALLAAVYGVPSLRDSMLRTSDLVSMESALARFRGADGGRHPPPPRRSTHDDRPGPSPPPGG
jgi:hypothetical protein